MSKIITCEQVSNGHPDKICDQIADAIVTDVLKHDKNARVAIECLLKKNQLFIAGEMTTDYQPNYHQLVHNVITRIGAEKMGFDFSDRIRIGVLVDKQSPDIALGVDKGGAGDQGMLPLRLLSNYATGWQWMNGSVDIRLTGSKVTVTFPEGKGVFTIVAESTGVGSTKGWGKLKSGAGWISLDLVTRI